MIKTLHVLYLIEQLAEKTGQALDYFGFGKMSEAIDDDIITQRYLDDLYRNMRIKFKNEKLFTRPSTLYLDAISKHLGYACFAQFSNSIDRPVSDVLQACFGSWWSYVRANTGNYLYKAPVRIYLDEKKQKVRIEMKGQERLFFGEIEEKGGCFSGFLESGTDKRIGLVFKLGSSLKVNVIQGTFCGISTMHEPIAGREVLVREKNAEYSKMIWSNHAMDDEIIDSRIRQYFSEYNDNCIKVRDVTGFELDDL